MSTHGRNFSGRFVAHNNGRDAAAAAAIHAMHITQATPQLVRLVARQVYADAPGPGARKPIYALDRKRGQASTQRASRSSSAVGV